MSVVGLAGLGGLLVTAVAFTVARNAFRQMWSDGREARIAEDSYSPDSHLLPLLVAAGIPFLVGILWLGCAALQTVSARAVARTVEPVRETPWRLGRVVAVFGLRSVIVWVLPTAGFLLGVYLEPYTFPRSPLFAALTGPPTLVALFLRLGLTLAPAAAAAGLGPLAALRRSWTLVWRRRAWLKTLAVALPAGVLTVAVYAVLLGAAGPLRRAVRSAVLAFATDNPYVAYAAGLLAPVAAALLLTAALTIPVVHTAFAVLHERFREARGCRETSRGAASGS
ncbi:hypothetical protein [Streptomyces cellulosae]|uniref:hypothetical protein n=1 Tax=Streptomyces cellulosae TaxID=1968 RepID=UPI000692427E|nr:hypothetical protein [Streptomyces cellulosae]